MQKALPKTTTQTNLSISSPSHSFSATVLELTTQGALLHSASRGAVKVGQDIGKADVLLDEQKIASVPRMIVKQTRPVEDGALIGVDFETSAHSDMFLDQRAGNRAVVIKPVDAKVVARHPVNQTDDVHFRAEDVSLDGMRLSTSLRNRFILPEMRFKNAKASLGHFEDFCFDFVIVHCRADEASNRLMVGVKFENLTDLAKQTLAGFLITNQEGASEQPMSLVRPINKSTRTQEIVRFTLATTMQHFLDLQMMRWRAGLASGKIDPTKTLPEHMMDKFDRRSKIIMGYIGEELVCSVRLTSCENPDDRFEIEEFVDLENRYDRFNTMEISRAWVIPELHGTDIVHSMIEFVSQTFSESKREWLVTSCKPEMLEFYSRMGFRQTGYHFKRGGDSPAHEVIEISSVRAIRSAGNSPVHWLYTYARVNEFLISRGYSKRSWFMERKLQIYRKVATVALNVINKKTAA